MGIAQQLSLEFYQLLKTKNKPQLSRRFIRVNESGSTELQRVSAGMEAGAATICEAITSSWSNGVVEGVCKSPEDAETSDVWLGRLRATEATGNELSGENLPHVAISF